MRSRFLGFCTVLLFFGGGTQSSLYKQLQKIYFYQYEPVRIMYCHRSYFAPLYFVDSTV